MAGFRKFFDKVTEWEWYTTPFMFHLFSHLILKANYKDGQYQGMPIKRGQLATTLPKLSAETGISIQSIRTCLKKLELTGNIHTQLTGKYRVITVCNYASYQDCENDCQQANQQAVQQDGEVLPSSPTPPLSISHEIEDRYNTNSFACAREENPFHVSSVMRDFYRGNPDGLIAEKIRRVREKLKKISPEIGMPPDEQEKFICYWCEHSEGSTTLRAEKETVFNIRERAARWMERNKPNVTRAEHNAEELRKFNAIFEQQYEQYPSPEYQ